VLEMKPSDWIALGALFVAALAIFQKPFFDWLQRPKLSIAVEAPEILPMHLNSGATIPSIWFRLVVTNDGRVHAHGAQIMVERLLQKNHNDEFAERTDFLPMLLQWSHCVPPLIEIDLLPGFSRRIDLICVPEPANTGTPNSLPIVGLLRVELPPSNLCHELRAGVYELDLAIGARNSRAKRRQLRLTLSEWRSDPSRIAECIELKAI
jgi:hypothetical protein